MKFIGLLAKCKTKLYEADIVKYLNNIYIIKWSDISATYYLSAVGSHDDLYFLNVTVSDIEVIGNTFEYKFQINVEKITQTKDMLSNFQELEKEYGLVLNT